MSAFFAHANAAQTPVTDVVQIFGTTLMDPDSGFDGVSTFTVPASWNGNYAIFGSNLRTNDNENTVAIQIERSTGGPYTSIGRTEINNSSAVSVKSVVAY